MSEEIVQYLEDELSIAWRKPGYELILKSCLFCAKGEKMYVNIELGSSRFGKFQCFSSHCGARGSLLALVMAIEDCGFTDAAKVLLRLNSGLIRAPGTSALANMLAQLGNGTLPSEMVDVSIPLPDEMVMCHQGDKYFIPGYLRARRITQLMCRRWELGWCSTGKYRGRVIIPIRCGGLSSFVARDMTGGSRRKYLNPATLASHFLMGYDYITKDAVIHCVEGSFDVIRWDSYGFPTVGYFGDRLRDDQIELLKAKKPAGIVLVPDPDAYTTAVTQAGELAYEFPDVRVVRLPANFRTRAGAVVKADPDSCPSRKAARPYIRSAIQVTNQLAGLSASFDAMRSPYSDAF